MLNCLPCSTVSPDLCLVFHNWISSRGSWCSGGVLSLPGRFVFMNAPEARPNAATGARLHRPAHVHRTANVKRLPAELLASRNWPARFSFPAPRWPCCASGGLPGVGNPPSLSTPARGVARPDTLPPPRRAAATPPQRGRNDAAASLRAAAETEFSRPRALPVGDARAPVLTG